MSMQHTSMEPHSSEKKSTAVGGGLTSLEQVTAKAGKSCSSKHLPILIGKRFVEKEASFFQPNCGLWSCPECGARNANRWLAILLHGMAEIDSQWFFVTFTAHEKWRKNASLINLRKNWPKLRKRLSRASVETLYYAWVYEPHKDTSWHVHLLCNAPLSTRWWKDNARSSGMGHQSKALAMENPGAVAGYVAKYLLKSTDQATRYPRGMRRVNVSQNWPRKMMHPHQSTWDEVAPLKRHLNPLHAFDELVKNGWKVTDSDYLRLAWYDDQPN